MAAAAIMDLISTRSAEPETLKRAQLKRYVAAAVAEDLGCLSLSSIRSQNSDHEVGRVHLARNSNALSFPTEIQRC